MYRNEKTREPFKRGGKYKGKGSVIEQKKTDVKQLYNAVIHYKVSTVTLYLWMSQTKKKAIFKTFTTEMLVCCYLKCKSYAKF